MINFFRKIRRKLADDNKLFKYSRYAIGEIVLVMVGILLALQVNNWNEQRKADLLEIQILQNFHKSLKKDLDNLNSNMLVNLKIKNSGVLLLDYMEQDIPYQDSLKIHFGNMSTGIWQFNINESPFESLKSKDINLISNEGLKEKIMLVYGRLNVTIREHQLVYNQFIIDASVNILNTRFESFWESNYETWRKKNNDYLGSDSNDLIAEMVPLDYSQLRVDYEFIYFLKSLINKYRWLIELQADGMKMAMESLIQDMEHELEIL